MNREKAVQIEQAVEAPTWLLWLVRGLVFLFPWTVATFGLASLIFLLLLLPALRYGRGWSSLAVWERRLMLGYGLAFLAMSLSLFNNQDMREGVQALERFLRLAMIVPIYLMFRRYRFSMGREMAAGAILACLVMGVQAAYQVEWLGLAVAKGAYHKIVFGDLAAWWGAVAALLAVTVLRGWALRLGVAAAIVAAVYASLLSQTRGAWLFILIVPTLLLWAQWRRINDGRGWVVAGMIILMLVTTGMAIRSEIVTDAIDRGMRDIEVFMIDPGAKGSSWGTRLNLWRNSLLLLKETPLLGSGAGDFQADMRRLEAEGRSWGGDAARYKHAHSIYFDALAKGGLLGFVATVTAFLLLPFSAFVSALRRAVHPWERFYAIGGVMLIVAFATFGLSEGLWSRNPFVNTYIVCLVVFLAGVTSSAQQTAADK